jgi:hypothetical protein
VAETADENEPVDDEKESSAAEAAVHEQERQEQTGQESPV